MEECGSTTLVLCFQIGAARDQSLCDIDLSPPCRPNEPSQSVLVTRIREEPALEKFGDDLNFSGLASAYESYFRLGRHRMLKIAALSTRVVQDNLPAVRTFAPDQGKDAVVLGCGAVGGPLEVEFAGHKGKIGRAAPGWD